MKTKTITAQAVGLRYRVTPESFRELAASVPLEAALEREPKNTADRNAIKVLLAGKRNFHVGYLSRALASELARKMDKGQVEIVRVMVVSLDEDDYSGEVEIELRKVKSPAKR